MNLKNISSSLLKHLNFLRMQSKSEQLDVSINEIKKNYQCLLPKKKILFSSLEL